MSDTRTHTQTKGQIGTKNLEDELRKRVLSEIRRRDLSAKDVAERLDMLPSGATMLLEKGSWPLDLAVRVAFNLGMDVELKVAAIK